MLKCRKDDLAIVLYSKHDREGALVNVVEFIGAFTSPIHGYVGEDVWKVEHKGDYHFGRDAWLLPIRPDELKETEETEKEIVTTK